MGYCAYSAMPVGRFVLDVHGESRATWPASDATLRGAADHQSPAGLRGGLPQSRPRLYPARCARRLRPRRRGARRAPKASPELRRCLAGLAQRTAVLLHEGDALPSLVEDWRLALEISVIQTLAQRLTGILTAARSVERTRASRQARRRRRQPARRASRALTRRAGSSTARPRRRSRERRDRRTRGRQPNSAPAAARSIWPCASCRRRSARRCSRSIRSAARSTTSPTKPARATCGSSNCSNGAPTSTRFTPARRRRTYAGLRAPCATSICSARISSPSSTAWRWTSLPTSARPIWRRFDLYCDRVASAVGRLSVRVFGMETQAGLALAHHLGRALQMTNILRDLDEDAAIGRLYLPREALARRRHRRPTSPRRCWPVRRSARPARRSPRAPSAISRKPRPSWRACPRRTVRTPRIMAAAYRMILDRLMARGWQPPRQPVRLRALAIPLDLAALRDSVMPRSVHIIGAGLAGLAAAVRLAAQGVRATRLRGDQPGGRALPLLSRPRARDRRSTTATISCCPATGRRSAISTRSARATSGRAAASASFPFIDLASHERWTLRANDGRIPWWIFDRRPPRAGHARARLSGRAAPAARGARRDHRRGARLQGPAL